jgi:hypothetical protein
LNVRARHAPARALLGATVPTTGCARGCALHAERIFCS